MGNSESVFKTKLSPLLANEATSISESNKYDQEFRQKIPDFPYMNTRLKPIDWKSIITGDEYLQGKLFNDPYFKSN